MRQPPPPRATIHEMRLRVLRDAVAVGERSGESTPFDFDAFLARKRTRKFRGDTN
jgi:antitoxin ParD1/3/4